MPPGPSLRRVALLVHPRLPAALDLAERLVPALRRRGLEPFVHDAWEWADLDDRVAELDAVVTLGGDGTVLRAARHTAAYGLPLVGVNFGVLGFLAELEPTEALARLPGLLDGEGRIEARLMLRATVRVDDRLIGPLDGLNDVFVGRGPVAHAVRLEVAVDETPLARFVADGVVVASPTGSTAYSLSAGGPVIAPQLDVLVVTPVVPHPAPVRPLVLPGATVVRINLRRDEEAILSVDGQVHHPLRGGDGVEVTAAPHRALFLRHGEPAAFYRTLTERLRR